MYKTIELLINSPSPHWIYQVLAGIILTMIVRDFIPNIWVFIKNIKASDPILGAWHVKHITFDKSGNLKLSNSKWRFERSFNGEIININVLTREGKAKFTGYTKRSSGNHCIYLYGKQKEELFYNVSKVFPDDSHTIGVWSGVDYRNNITAAPAFFSKEPISDIEFAKIIQRNFGSQIEALVVSLSPISDRGLKIK